MYIRYSIICLLILITPMGFAQVTVGSGNQQTAKESLQKVSESIEKGESDETVAANYEKLAKDLSAQGDHARAEDYLNRARKLYEKLKNKEKMAEVDREIAKAQEAQKKFDVAAISYKKAQSNTSSQTMKRANALDAERVSDPGNMQLQASNLQKNANLFKKTSKKDERAFNFLQQADVNRSLNNNEVALGYLDKALEEVKDQPEASWAIKQEIADTYLASNQPGKAIEVNKDLLAEARKEKNTVAEVKQLQNLSTSYIEANREKEALYVLQEAYKVAVDNGQTLNAKTSLESLVDQYKKNKQPQKALDAYADFVNRLEMLVKGDSTLIDDKLFQVQEEKIVQLEKERVLKDELISKQNKFNYALIGVIFLILIFLLFIAKALYSIKKKNKRIALQSLRREMNPHFIFNSLNSVNQFIAQNNELEANKYLSSYSKLMRNVMENSNKDFIPLSVEIDQMKEYLDLEYMRFHDKFTYQINIDESLDADSILIPNMIIQPQLENAIWHGLRYKEDTGLLTLTFRSEKGKLSIVIEDNGIGIRKSQELKTKHQRKHNSRGLNNTHERIDLLNSLYNTEIRIDVKEKEEPETGVIVTLQLPLIEKNKWIPCKE